MLPSSGIHVTPSPLGLSRWRNGVFYYLEVLYGMGILGTTLLGVFLFHEKLSVPQVICVILIVVGIAGLKILAKE